MKIEHIALWTKDIEKIKVNQLTYELKTAGYRVVSEPRQTGDGYYESCILDPDGNRVEITV